jgi:mono/diheme cytochrome c family protein
MNRLLPALVMASLALACSDEQTLAWPDWDLNRMVSQPRYQAFDARLDATDGSAMRAPPAGTVSRTPPLARPPMTRALLDEGRRHFETVCGACHGVLGDGDTVVADNMPQVKPPSLHSDRFRSMRDEELEGVIALGWGMMPPYAYMLDQRERWAVVAYVRALQLSQHAPFDALPPALQQRVLGEVGP